MVIFVVTAVSNGANMTDGLDGLAAGTSAIIGVALGILAYMSSHFEFASFLNIMFIPGAEELVVYAAAFIGATVGFLWYKSYPALFPITIAISRSIHSCVFPTFQ